MLGNMGFNKAVCISSYVQLNSNPTNLTCEAGVMTTMTYAGIIPDNNSYDYDINPYGYCGNPNITAVSSDNINT